MPFLESITCLTVGEVDHPRYLRLADEWNAKYGPQIFIPDYNICIKWFGDHSIIDQQRLFGRLGIIDHRGADFLVLFQFYFWELSMEAMIRLSDTSTTQFLFLLIKKCPSCAPVFSIA